MTVTNPLNRPKRCTWQYDPKVFPQLRGWFCVHTTVPGTKRCERHPEIALGGSL